MKKLLAFLLLLPSFVWAQNQPAALYPGIPVKNLPTIPGNLVATDNPIIERVGSKYNPGLGSMGQIFTYFITNLTTSEIIGFWTGTCNSTTYLRGDGTCFTPAGGGGSGTVNSGTLGQIAYYAADGTTVSGLATTGSGSAVLATAPTLSSPVLTTPNLGTPSALNLANATNLPTSALAAGTTGSGAVVLNNSPSIALGSMTGGIAGSAAVNVNGYIEAPNFTTATQTVTLGTTGSPLAFGSTNSLFYSNGASGGLTMSGY